MYHCAVSRGILKKLLKLFFEYFLQLFPYMGLEIAFRNFSKKIGGGFPGALSPKGQKTSNRTPVCPHSLPYAYQVVSVILC